MDLVHQADQPGDIGICQEHNRIFECYCNLCFCMICPSCLMFGTHKGHDVCKIDEGARELRKNINNSARQGFLKFDKTENVLLDIRHVKLSLEESEQMIIKEAQSNFDQLISILKSRKNKFIAEVRQHFSVELRKIQQTQADWVRKQEFSQKVLQLQTSKDDIKLMQEGRNVVEGLKQLAQPLGYKEIKLLDNIKAESSVGKSTFSTSEIKQILKNFMQKGTPTLNKLKC